MQKTCQNCANPCLDRVLPCKYWNPDAWKMFHALEKAEEKLVKVAFYVQRASHAGLAGEDTGKFLDVVSKELVEYNIL